MKSKWASALVGVCGVILMAMPVRGDQVDDLEVGVRAAILDKPLNKLGKPIKGQTLPTHGKIYGLLAVEEVKALEKLVRPVDEAKLVAEVRQQLEAQGFQRAPKGTRPEILLTVQYGRTQISNPYFGLTAATEGAMGEGYRRNLTAADLPAAYDLGKPGAQMKAQKAETEKLCIRITAWENSTKPNAKAKRLWNTLMIVDDPDHRDLNNLAPKLLAAGAPYFGKDVEEPELEISTGLPEGNVRIGTPEVVETKAGKKR